MHEIGVMQSVLDAAVAEAGKRNATRIHSIRLRVGAFAGVVPDSLQFAFEALIEDTMAAGASLVIERTPARCYCAACEKEFEIQEYLLQCPTCREFHVTMRSGRELEMVSMEIS